MKKMIMACVLLSGVMGGTNAMATSSAPRCMNATNMKDGTTSVVAQQAEGLGWFYYSSSQASCGTTFTKLKNATPVPLYFLGSDQSGGIFYWAEKNTSLATYSASRTDVIKGFGSNATFDLKSSTT